MAVLVILLAATWVRQAGSRTLTPIPISLDLFISTETAFS